MPSGFTGLDPEQVRELAAAMRRAARCWSALERDLASAGTEFFLEAELAGPRGELAELIQLHERAAADLDARADLAVALDRGEWHVVAVHTAEIARTDASWEAAAPGGPDEGASSTWTRTTWADLEARMLAVVDPVASALCAEDGWYREAGTIIGPDGQAYPILVPNVRNPEASGEDDVFVHNDEWGPTGAAAVTALDGADPGWSTVGVETGSGRLGDGPGALGLVLIGAAGAAGARHLDATGLRPVPLAVYDRLGFDSSWVPDHVPYGVRAGAGTASSAELPDVPDEVSGVTPERVVTPRGHVRYESTVPASTAAVLALGAADAVNQVAVGTGNVRTVQDRRNLGYAVEYQVNRDGRTRAMARGYQLAVDDDGEIHVAMGYLGVDEDGAGPLVATVPRVHDGYSPAFATNGIPPG